MYQRHKLDLEKAEEPEFKLSTTTGSYESKGIPENICFIDYTKVFACVGHNKLWEILKEIGIPDYPYLSSEKPVCRSRNNIENQTWNKGLVQNWERSTSRLYIVTLLI